MPDDKKPGLEPVLRQYINRTGQMFENYGFPRICGQMGALLYLHRGPMSLDEISEFLGVSKGSISLNGRALVRMRYVKITRVAGDRRDFYEFAGNLWSALSEAGESFIHSEVEDFQHLNAEFAPVLTSTAKKSGSEAEDARHFLQQIKDLDELFAFISRLASLIRTIKKTPLGKLSGLLNRLFALPGRG